jgi:hypothetical protein
MDQRDYSGYYQSSHQSTSAYGSTNTSARASYQTSPPRSNVQYSHASPASPTYTTQPAYLNQPYDAQWQASNYPVDETLPCEATRHGRSVSHSPGPSSMTSSRRREQNRLAQRALRQRRENHIKELEDRVLHTSLETRHLAVENRNLNQRLHSVALENDALRHEQMASNSSAAAWAQHHAATAHAAAYSSYDSTTSGCEDGYSQYYQDGSYSTAPSSRPASEPTPSSADWPWDDALNPSDLDPSFAWPGEEEDQAEYCHERRHNSGGSVEHWLDERPPSWRRGA